MDRPPKDRAIKREEVSRREPVKPIPHGRTDQPVHDRAMDTVRRHGGTIPHPASRISHPAS